MVEPSPEMVVQVDGGKAGSLDWMGLQLKATLGVLALQP
jgi:hypothetical protein